MQGLVLQRGTSQLSPLKPGLHLHSHLPLGISFGTPLVMPPHVFPAGYAGQQGVSHVRPQYPLLHVQEQEPSLATRGCPRFVPPQILPPNFGQGGSEQSVPCHGFLHSHEHWLFFITGVPWPLQTSASSLVLLVPGQSGISHESPFHPAKHTHSHFPSLMSLTPRVFPPHSLSLYTGHLGSEQSSPPQPTLHSHLHPPSPR